MRPNVVNQNLDPQNLLLLYAADELSPAERRQVEQRLEEQPSLRDELHQMQAMQQAIGLGMARLDAGSSPSNAETIVRRVGRSIRQELARPRMKLTGHGVSPQRRVWPWVLPTAAAASILVAAAVWIDRHVGLSNQPRPVIVDKRFTSEPVTQPDEPVQPDENLALWLDSSESDLANSRRVEEDIRTVADNQDPVSQYMLSSTVTRG